MSSCGYLYFEEMNEVTSAKNGIYYVTNTIEFQNNPLKKSPPVPVPPLTNSPNGTGVTNVFGGGVSVYFSFKLGLLFWSYQQGKTFLASFKPKCTLVLDKVFPLHSSSTTGTNKSTGVQQALCNWSEIAGHPGLVLSMTLLSNNPVVLMILPDKIYLQEIKLVNNQGGPSKAKIQDMVAIRHASSSGISFSSASLQIVKSAQEGTITPPTLTEELSVESNSNDITSNGVISYSERTKNKRETSAISIL
jgi:E3 ubiquitin-protein ligase UBR4